MADKVNPDYDSRAPGGHPDSRQRIPSFKSRDPAKTRSKSRSSGQSGGSVMDPENMPTTHYDKSKK